MTRPHFRCVLFTALAAWFFALVSPAISSVIISDSFTADDGTTLAGRTPPPPGADVPGGSYTSGGATGYDENFVIMGNQAQIGPNTAITIPFDSGSYIPGGDYLISADLTIATTTTATRGVGLGFWGAAPGGAEALTNFTGLVLSPNGNLSLFVGNAVVGSPIAFGGTFSPSSAYHLSYIFAVATGQLSGVSLGLSTADYSGLSSSAFTLSNIALAGFADASDADFTFGDVDNFQISTVPEPASLSLLAGGALVMLRRRK